MLYLHYKYQYKSPQDTAAYTEKEGEILGIFAGDGSFTYYKPDHHYRGYIAISIKETAYAHHIKTLFGEFFNREFKIRYHREDILKVVLRSKQLYDYFHDKLDFNDTYKASTIHLKSVDAPRNFYWDF